jgi:transposase
MDLRFADVPDDLWSRIESLLPREAAKPLGGRPRVADRVVMAGIIYRLKTGCQWKALPGNFSSGSTCHLRFQQWQRIGVFEQIYAELLRYYDKRNRFRALLVRWERKAKNHLALVYLASALIAYRTARR